MAHVVRHWRAVKTDFDAEMLEERTFYGNASFWLVLHIVSAFFGLGLAGLTVIMCVPVPAVIVICTLSLVHCFLVADICRLREPMRDSQVKCCTWHVPRRLIGVSQ